MDSDLFFLRFESQRSTPPQMHNSWLKMAGVFVWKRTSNAAQTHLKRAQHQLKRTSNALGGVWLQHDMNVAVEEGLGSVPDPNLESKRPEKPEKL